MNQRKRIDQSLFSSENKRETKKWKPSTFPPKLVDPRISQVENVKFTVSQNLDLHRDETQGLERKVRGVGARRSKGGYYKNED